MEHVRKVLDEMGYELKREVRDKIYAENAVATGDLLNSIDFAVEEDADGTLTLYLTHADYFHYVNENTKPHWAPIAPLIQWVQDKPLATSLPEVKSIAYAVKQKIKDEGTQGHYFLEAALNGLLEKYYPLIVDAIYADIEEDMAGLI